MLHRAFSNQAEPCNMGQTVPFCFAIVIFNFICNVPTVCEYSQYFLFDINIRRILL